MFCFAMQRTMRVPILYTPKQDLILQETMRAYTACFNTVAVYGWEKQVTNGVKLHKATYYALRTEFPTVPSQLVISSRSKATEAVKSTFSWKAKHEKAYKRKVAKAKAQGRPIPKFKPVRCPCSSMMSIRYDARSYALRGDHVSLATIRGRQVLRLHFYPYALRLLQQCTGYDSAELVYRKGRFFLHLVVTLPGVEFIPTGEAVGVDFGISRPTVASNNRFFGNTSWKATERRYFRLKRALQSKGTKSTRRHLKKLSGRTARFRTDCDHVVSRQLVQSVVPGTSIVLEDLRNIRSTTKQKGKTQRRAMHQRSFRRLAALLAYKAEAYGCAVVSVDPHYTSQTCSRCGYVHHSNRLSRSRFKCRKCGFELHADLNASRNIAEKHHASLGKAKAGGLPSTSLS
jgi:putative transposase